MKNFETLLAMLLIALCPLAFTACSDDDDEGGSAYGSDTAGQVTGSNGSTYYITACNKMSFDYEDGRIVAIDDGYFDYEVTYNPFTITYADGDPNEDDSYEVYTISNIKVNSSGYITSLSISGESRYYYNSGNCYYYDKGSGSASFSYDSDGHLVKTSVSVSNSGKDVYYDEVESYSGSGSVTTTNTWSDGLLTKSVYNYSYKESGYSETATSTDTYEYSTSYPNVTYQFTPWDYDVVGDLCSDFDILEPLAIVGYFGKGPDYHPTSRESEWIEYDSDDYDYESDGSYTYKYDINSYGAVSKYYYKSSSKWYGYSFTYNLLSSSTKSVGLTDSEEAKPATREHRGMFRKLLSKKSATATEE